MFSRLMPITLVARLQCTGCISTRFQKLQSPVVNHSHHPPIWLAMPLSQHTASPKHWFNRRRHGIAVQLVSKYQNGTNDIRNSLNAIKVRYFVDCKSKNKWYRSMHEVLCDRFLFFLYYSFWFYLLLYSKAKLREGYCAIHCKMKRKE